MRTTLLVFALLFGLNCAQPKPPLAVSPAAHGALTSVRGPQAVAWRPNTLAAPCALHCRDMHQGGGLACDCHAVDAIYFSHLERAAQAQTVRRAEAR